MSGGANLFFRATMSLLLLSFVVSVAAKLDESENHPFNTVLNPKQDVQSTLGSILIRHIGRLTDTYPTFARHRGTAERMNNKHRLRSRKLEMNSGRWKMAGKSREAIDQDRLSGSPRLPDEFEANQVTFTSPDSRGLTIQVKPFMRSQRIGRRRIIAVSYKVYVLEGQNIRHYNVVFSSGGLVRATLNARQRVANCIRRRYIRRCIDLPLRRKGLCTTRIVERCVPGFVVFEEVFSVTEGTRRSSPLPSPNPILSPSPELDSVDEEN